MLFQRRAMAGLVLIWLLVLSACGQSATQNITPSAASAPTVATVTNAPGPTPVAATTVSAPTEAPATATIASWPVQVTDAIGRNVTIASEPQRIISIAPNITEILFALNLAPRIIAVDDFSDYPAAARTLPKIGGINVQYNFEQIVSFTPDLIIAAGVTPPEVIKQLEDLKLTVVMVGSDKTTLDSIFSDIALTGQITGQNAQATELVNAMQTQLDALKAKLTDAKTTPRVYWELDATDPSKPFSVGPGNFVDDLLTMAGGSNIFQHASSPYPQVSTEQIVAADPEVIILSDAAYGIEPASVGQRPGWQNITAVQQQRVEPIDDNLVSRPGPRVIEGLVATAKIIHPELFK